MSESVVATRQALGDTVRVLSYDTGGLFLLAGTCICDATCIDGITYSSLVIEVSSVCAGNNNG